MFVSREQIEDDIQLLEKSKAQTLKDFRDTVGFYGRRENVPRLVVQELRSREARLTKQIERMTIKLNRCS